MKKLLFVPVMILFVLAFGGVAAASESGAVIVIHNETSKTAVATLDYICNYDGGHAKEGKPTYSIDASGGETIISDIIDACLSNPSDTFMNIDLSIEGSNNGANIDINGYAPMNAETSKCSAAVMGSIHPPRMVLESGSRECAIRFTYK